MAPDSQEIRLLAELKRAVEASSDVVFTTDADGIISFVNPRFTAVYGYTAAEVVGKATPRILKSGVHSTDQYHRFWADLLAGQSVAVRMVNRAKSGALIEIEGSANPIIADGVVAGFVAVQRDVTLQHVLQNQHRLAQFASDEAADGILWVAQDSRIHYANATAAEMLGHSREALTRLSVPDIAPAFDHDHFVEHFRAHFAIGKTRLETAMRRRDGTSFPAEIAISYREIDDQRTSCAVIRDLTERKHLESELQQAQKMEVIGRLTSGIAHDFNNILTAILGYTELAIEQTDQGSSLAADLAEVRLAAERAGRLTRQLLGFSRKQVVAPRTLDLSGLVGEFRSMAARMIGEDVVLEVETETPLYPVRLDPGQVEQVLLNLLVNARDAMPKGGHVRILTRNVEVDDEFVRIHPDAVAGRYAVLSVSDTGCGMTPEVVARATEPFFTTKPEGKGTGLGLATVRDVVRDNGGCLIIESRLGVGTVITCYFPCAEAAGPVDAVPRPSGDLIAGHETVLVVDDDAAIRDLLARVLGDHGYRVLTARDGLDALARASAHTGLIHLLVTDVLMPALGGPDVAQRLVSRWPAMKVLYISGFGHHIAAASRLLNWKTGFLQKPFTPEVLVAAVRDLLNRDSEPMAPPVDAVPPPGRAISSRIPSGDR